MAKLIRDEDLSLVSLASTFATTSGQPLTKNEIFYSLTDAEVFAESDSAYVGQKIVVIENNVVAHYSISAFGKLEPLTSKDEFLEALKASVTDVVKAQIDANNSRKFLTSFAVSTAKDDAGNEVRIYTPYFTTLDDGVLG